MIDITGKDYKEEITEGVALLLFVSSSCGPCETLKPELETLEATLPDVKFYFINVTKARRVATQLGINAVPAVVFLKDGEIVTTVKGQVSKSGVKYLLKNLER